LLKVVENKDGIVNDFKIRGNFGKTGKFSPNSAISRGSYGLNGFVDSNANADLKWETTQSYGIGADLNCLITD
jgi:iron complex outermembrane receptor protein